MVLSSNAKTNLVALSVALALVFGLTTAYLALREDPRAIKPRLVKQAVAKETSQTAEPPPVITEGAPNWTAVVGYLDTAPPEEASDFLTTLQEIHGQELTLGKIREYASKEQNEGKNYQAVVPAGTWVVNTTRPSKDGPIKVLWKYQLREDRVVLVDEKGEVRILSSCGNISRILELPKGKEVVPCPPPKTPPVAQKPPRNSSPETTPHHPGNPSTQPPQENTEKAVPTPGVVPGVPEDAKQGQDENADNPDPVPGGKTGEDTGGIEDPDGNVTPSPPPTSPPDTTDPGFNEGDPGMPD